MTSLPSYDELSEVDGVKVAWGVFGGDDALGTLNLLTEERARRGAALVRRGAVFNLDAPLDEIDPPLFSREPIRHAVSAFPSGNAFDDHVTFFNTQASSQWDGFRHIRDPDRGFYNDRAPEDLGIDRWAARGIVGRGVLADVARAREAAGRTTRMDGPDSIEPSELAATLDSQGVAVEAGDVLLVRTGWLAWYRKLSPGERAAVDPDSGLPGLAAHEGTARLLWDLHVAAVAADNPGLEVFPHADDHLHWHLLPRLGIPIGELWDLEQLAADCASDGVYDFLLTSSPLNLRDGVATPPNALAVK